jgi:hypothetical protein
MVFNATFSNISVISWRSVLLVEETGGLGEITDLSQVTDKVDHIILHTLLCMVALFVYCKNNKLFKTLGYIKLHNVLIILYVILP